MTELEYAGPVFICAGEPSGDLYASLLMENLKSIVKSLKPDDGQSPTVKVQQPSYVGVGGDTMRACGVEVLLDCSALSAFGFASGISSVVSQYQVYRKIARLLYRTRPKTFIAVAYPGINLLLCRYAKKLSCTVYYFVPPQIWAWAEFRKYFIKKWVDRIISVFPFERDFYENKGIPVEYVEHPLIEKLKVYQRRDFQKRIGFMPGSRISEIKRNLPVIIELIKRIAYMKPGIEFSLIVHSQTLVANDTWIATVLKSLKKLYGHNLEIVTNSRYQAMKNCDLLIICSGTASFEAACMNIPQIFFNRPSWFDYYIMKWFLETDEYNLANLYYTRNIVPTFVARGSTLLINRTYARVEELLID